MKTFVAILGSLTLRASSAVAQDAQPFLRPPKMIVNPGADYQPQNRKF